jgi:hypothetical protein
MRLDLGNGADMIGRGTCLATEPSKCIAQAFDVEEVVGRIVNRMPDDPVRINVCTIEDYGPCPSAIW